MPVNTDRIREHFLHPVIMENTSNTVDEMEVWQYSVAHEDSLKKIIDALREPKWKFTELIGKAKTKELLESLMFFNQYRDVKNRGISREVYMSYRHLSSRAVGEFGMDFSWEKKVVFFQPKSQFSTLFTNKMVDLFEVIGFECTSKTKFEVHSLMNSLYLCSIMIILEGSDLDGAIDVIVNKTWGENFFPEYPVRYVLVQEPFYAEFLSRLASRTKSHVNRSLGVKFNHKYFQEKVDKVTGEAIRAGAHVEVIKNHTGCWSPTILKEFKGAVKNAPVVSAFSFRTAAEAVKIANSIKDFDGAAIWGHECLDIAYALENIPEIWINCYDTGHFSLIPRVPKGTDTFHKPVMAKQEVQYAIFQMQQCNELKELEPVLDKLYATLWKCYNYSPPDCRVLISPLKAYNIVPVQAKEVKNAAVEILSLLFLGHKIKLNPALARNQTIAAMLQFLSKDAIAMDDLVEEFPQTFPDSPERFVQSIFDKYYYKKCIYL